MKVVVDVNFPPSLAVALATGEIQAVHWTAVGEPTAPDSEILRWARDNGHVVLTQDLDFPEILATTGDETPSVVLVRRGDTLAAGLPDLIISALRQCSDALTQGAIVVLDARGRRVRTLPIR